MFTGIIETVGVLKDIRKEGSNIHFDIESSISAELKIDQSVSHNGVCLTVVGLDENNHTVTAIDETLRKSNLGQWKIGTKVNLERCMLMNGRLDGHIVQGHVDQTAVCVNKADLEGSSVFTFRYAAEPGNVTVEKGSVSVNGVSLTVVNSRDTEFSVAIIPYTLEYTNFQDIRDGTTVNLEFDIIGKYIARLMPR